MSRNLGKKAGQLALCIATVFAIAGCNGEEKKGEATSTGQPTPTEQTDTGKFEPKKDLELSYWYSHGSDIPAKPDPKENIPGDWLEKTSRVKIKEGFGNGGLDPNVKLGTMITGNMVPSFAISSNQTGFDKAIEGKLLWELTPEMMKKYAPNVWNSYPEFVWDSVKKDGKIYGIPYELLSSAYGEVTTKSADWKNFYSVSPQSVTWNSLSTAQGFIIRDDILKTLFPSALGYDEAVKLVQEKNASIAEKFILPIDTTEKFVKLFTDIKNLNLKENNKPVYAFGYPKGDNWTALTALGSEMMGYKSYNYMSMYNSTSKKLEFGLQTPIVKEAAKIQNQLIRDAVIDPESVVHTAEIFKEKVLNGQYAITSILSTGSVGLSNLVAINTELEKAGKKFKYVPLFTSVPNKPEYPAQYTVPVSGGTNSYVWLFKTIKEEDLPQVLNWLNILFSKEWEEIKYWGPQEAGLYETTADGKRKFKDPLLQKGAVEYDKSIDPKELKGFATTGHRPNRLVDEIRPYPTEWNYDFMNGTDFKKNLNYSFFTFPSTSPYSQNLKKMPEFSTWKTDFKSVADITTLMNARGVWEDSFKIALVAKSEGEFETKWQNALQTLNNSANINKILEEQMKIFAPMLQAVESRK
ncbi:hypothetical protein [Paenibacillus contaminans]|uniref:ABC transporter substrate-binding protein n=1 Tax=Paenibacillus contaminans TaxID=450362 RepID=A0A329MG74_9BACL|nr:hypothetical protein [Paenibacillus contaminans]RAV18905.1 hypothetical protein DQG23_22375 [Paenibacillus contaminans]